MKKQYADPKNVANKDFNKKLPKSLRVFIRQEKARIRREWLDFDKQKELISQLYSRFRA